MSSSTSARLKNTNIRLIEAYQRGYYVTEDGRLFGVKGQLKLSTYGKQRYPTFSTNWGGYVYGLPAHRLAAYCFYGEALFEDGIVVRHLDADTLNLSKSNIFLGTCSQNERDKPLQTRVRVAKGARAAQGSRPFNAKLSDEDVLFILDYLDRVSGRKAPQGYIKALCKTYAISRTTIQDIRNGKNYPEVHRKWLNRKADNESN